MDIFKQNKIKTYGDLKGRTWNNYGIPKWIFKTGPNEVNDIPEVYKYVFLDMLDKNPEYEIFYFSDTDCENYIRDNYGEEYLMAYNSLTPTAYKADLWRYCILNQYGGCYGDFSQIPLIPYDEITDGVDRVFVRDDPSSKSFLYNAVMCCKANDEVVNNALNISINNIKNKNYGICPLDVTGPTVLGQAFRQSQHNYNSTSEDIFLGTHKGTKILQLGKKSNILVSDENGEDIFVTKLQNHNGVVYNEKHKNLHYYRAWEEKRVFKY
jgi:mannosyltransferase OCH1-like enzyme